VSILAGVGNRATARVLLSDQ